MVAPSDEIVDRADKAIVYDLLPGGRQKIHADFYDSDGRLIETRHPRKLKSTFIGLSDENEHRWNAVDPIVTYGLGGHIRTIRLSGAVADPGTRSPIAQAA